MNTYILIDKTPVHEPNLLKWARWFETSDRYVDATLFEGGWRLSTVFLGLDHNYASNGPPLLFETMTFSPWGKEVACKRCTTWDEAVILHKSAVMDMAPLRVIKEAK